MDISTFKSWLARERNAIKARIDELDRVVEKFESCVEGE